MVLSCPAFSCRPRPKQPKSSAVSVALMDTQACPNFSSVMQKQGIPVQLCEPCLHQKPSYIFPNHAKILSHHYPHVFALCRYEHDISQLESINHIWMYIILCDFHLYRSQNLTNFLRKRDNFE